ncbi:MAG: hypothetical protein ACYCZP_05190 [Acidimicrobiales bacterium]
MYVVRIEALDDLASEGCPVCTAVERVERAWLGGLLDDVGDAKVRSALERGGGLCAAHVRLLVEVAADSGKTLGLCVVLEVLLSQARGELATREPLWRGCARRLARKRSSTEWPDDGCGACNAVRLRERAYAELLLAAGDATLRRRAGDPRSALCRPHLARLRDAAVTYDGASVLHGAARAKVDELLIQVARSMAAHQVGSEIGSDAHGVILQDAPDWLAGRAGNARTWGPRIANRDRRRRS